MGQRERVVDGSKTGGAFTSIDVPFFLVLGFIISLFLTTRIPIGDQLIVLGQTAVGPAVITISDIYIGLTAICLVAYHRQVWVPRSRILLLLILFSGVILVSIIFNNRSLSDTTELIQWVEVLLIVGVIGLLIRHDWQRRRILWAFVFVGTVRATWTVMYYFLYGFPGRRFDVFIEGAALVVLGGLLLKERNEILGYVSAVPLAMAVIVAQERKVWVAAMGAYATMLLLFLIQNGRRSSSLIRLGIGVVLSISFVGLISVSVAPQGVINRVLTLLAVIPGIGGPAEFERAYIFQTGFEMVRHNPILGVGPENWFTAKDQYATERLVAFEERTNSDLGPHSLPLRILAETGLLGFGLFVLLLIEPLRNLRWHLSSSRSLYTVLFGLYVYVATAATFRAGGFIVRAIFAIMLGGTLSYELWGSERS